jgi:hypothetical protein
MPNFIRDTSREASRKSMDDLLWAQDLADVLP